MEKHRICIFKEIDVKKENTENKILVPQRKPPVLTAAVVAHRETAKMVAAPSPFCC